MIKRLAYLAPVVFFLVACNKDEKPLIPAKGGEAMGDPHPASSGLTKDSDKVKDVDVSGAASSGSHTDWVMPKGDAEPLTPGTDSVEIDKPGEAKPPSKSGPVKKPEVPKPSQTGWKPTTVNPSEVATKADSSLAQLQNTQLNLAVLMTHSGGHGNMFNRAKIRDHNNYWVNYAAFEGGLHQGSTQYSFGTIKKRKTPTATKDLGGATFQGPKLDSNKLLASWWLDAPKLLMNPWVENRPVFADLLAAFKAQGFTVVTQERVMDFHGKQLKNYRIVADRAAASAKASGPAHTEIVFDAARGLPVSIFVSAAPPKQAPIALNLRADWRFNIKFSDKALQTFGDVG